MANTATLKPPKPQIPTAAAPAANALPAASRFAFAMLSHRGRVRHTNQDACAALPSHGAFVICDGMGGAAGGEVASHLATEAFLNSLSHSATDRSRRPPASAAAEPYPPGHPHARLREAVRAANHAVFQRAQKSRSLRGMGTTLVALLAEAPAPPSARAQTAPPPSLWLVHVGDSRCYLFRRAALHLLTRDHSLVEEQIHAGLLDRAGAAASPIRNIITRAIGTQPAVEPEIAAHATQPGDLYLLASDGLTRELDDPQIAQILSQALNSAAASALESACQALIDAAIQHGGRDNITTLLLACP